MTWFTKEVRTKDSDDFALFEALCKYAETHCHGGSVWVDYRRDSGHWRVIIADHRDGSQLAALAYFDDSLGGAMRMLARHLHEHDSSGAVALAPWAP